MRFFYKNNVKNINIGINISDDYLYFYICDRIRKCNSTDIERENKIFRKISDNTNDSLVKF